MKGITLILLSLLSLVCGFNNVLVIVLEDNTYLSTIQGKGVVRDFHYGSLENTVVASLKKNQVPWKIYTDDYINCYLDPSVFTNFTYLLSYEDIADQPTRCKHIGSAVDLNRDLDRDNFPTFGFYFLNQAHNEPAWLRNFFYWKLRDSYYVENTLTVLLAPGKESGYASVLLLGNAVQTEILLGTGIFNTMELNGFALTEPIHSNNSRSGPWFEKIFIVILENQPLKESLGNENMRDLASQGTLLTEFYAIVNPSQPNYIALTAGDLMGVSNDMNYDLTGRFIVDLMEEKGVSWKAYMENFPGNCFPDAASPDNMYRRKHNPFMSFEQVRNNDTLCSKIVNANELRYDVSTNSMPQYSFYTPNIDNDGHDTGLDFGAEWLKRFMEPLLLDENFMSKTLVVVTFDEGIKPDNKIYTLLLGDMIPFRSLDKTEYTHYSLLATIEDNFFLGSLGRNDDGAVRIHPDNFYPGTPDIPESGMIFYVLIGVTGLLVLITAGVAVFYLAVIRHRKAKISNSSFVDLEDSGELLRGGE